MKLLNFQGYLTSKPSLMSPAVNCINEREQLLLRQIASLPVQSEEVQVTQLQGMLTEISVTDIDDALRLRLLAIVMMAMESSIAALRKQYIYAIGALSNRQLEIVNQVESLYYLAVMVFDAVVQRESLRLQYQQQQVVPPSFWQRMITPESVPPVTLAVAIYQALTIYQNLLFEKAIYYQKPLRNMWLSLNQLYFLAYEHNITELDLTPHVATRQAGNIHQLYCQICLYSLFNVLAMRRTSMLLIQRLLPEWASHLVATIDPQTQTRVFIDLNSDAPPQYLTATTTINPYKENQDCLFIELEPLAAYLKLRQHELLAQDNALNEYRLITQILMIMTYRYIAREPTMIAKYSPKKRATLIAGFNDVHYHVAGNRGLKSMVAAQDLSTDYLPRYDTVPRKEDTPPLFEIEINDDKDSVSHFRTLRLLTAQDILTQRIAINDDISSHQENSDKSQTLISPPLNEIFQPIMLEETKKINEGVKEQILATAPPRLRMMNLCLLTEHEEPLEQEKYHQKNLFLSAQSPETVTEKKKAQALVVIRWLTIKEEYVEVESQTLGYYPTACALRLGNRDNRSQSFVPTLLLAEQDELKTPSSLLVPTSHFKVNDKVIIRLNDKQKSLRLQSVLLTTDEFTQYEVLVL